MCRFWLVQLHHTRNDSPLINDGGIVDGVHRSGRDELKVGCHYFAENAK